MESVIVKLSFSSPVHFGKKRLADSEHILKADTLFSALFIESLNLGIDSNMLLNDIVISDSFPYVADELYLPKPLISISASQQEEDYKIFKKLQYIPVNHFKDYIDGNVTSVQAKEMADTFELGKPSTVTKVSLTEVDYKGDAAPYNVGIFQFNKNSGLYFLLQYPKHYQSDIIQILDALQYSGLGGKRTSGYGRFTYEIIKKHNIFKLTIQGSQILLSSAMVQEHEAQLLSEDDRYTLTKRTGYIQSETFDSTLVKKRDFFSFNSGSVFKNKFKGTIVDVGDNGMHPVYRYAKAYWLGGIDNEIHY